MEKKKLISLLNLSCNNFNSLERLLQQKNVIINNKRLKEKDLLASKGKVKFECLDTDTEQVFTITCENDNGKLTKFKL